MSTEKVNLKTEALKNGAIWGAISVVIFLIFWYLLRDFIGGTLHIVFTIIVGLALAIFFCLDMRKKAGFWSFGEALWPIFVMFLLSAAIVYIFTLIFGNLIDGEYITIMKSSIMEKNEALFKSFGLSDDKLTEALAKAEEAADRQLTPTFFQAIVGFGITAIFYFIGAVIFALIFKKNNPNPLNLRNSDVEVA